MAETTYISLFAGAGGFDLALRIAVPEAKCVAAVEIEAPAAAIMAARMEDGSADEAPIFSDVRTFPCELYRGRVAGIIGGFPCTDLSVAGKQAGITGEHSGLWFEYVRIIREVQPRWVLIENVPPVLHLGAGTAVLGELAALRFDAEWLSLRASDVGAPHQRKRVFILAYREGVGRREGRPESARLEGRSNAVERNGAVADAQNADRRRGEPEQQSSARFRRGGSGCAGGVLGHADQPGPQGRSMCGYERANERAARATGATELADADEYRCEGSRLHVPERRPQQTIPDTYGPVALFPPGPGATDEWQRILADRPWLAPATQPGLRVMADDMAMVLDEARTDQLRAGGNGVVALCGAAAIRELVRRAGITL